MAYTLTITNESPQALAFIKEAKKLDFVKITKTKKTKPKVETSVGDESRVYNAQQEKFRRKLLKALKQADDVRTGKIKAGKLDDLLNEL